MIIAKQSTAFETAIGPVLDADGVAVTDCVVGDFKLKKTSGNFAALNGSATLTHVSAGVYDLVLTTSDTDTVGVSVVAIDDTTNACPLLYLQVIEGAVYDAYFADSAPGYFANAPVSVAQWAGSNVATPTVNGVPEVDVTHVAGSAATADDPNTLLTTTIATLASQTSFTLTAGSADNDAYNGCVIVFRDQSTAVQKAIGWIDDYTGSTRTVTMEADPGVFTVATGDTVDILPPTGLSQKRAAQAVWNAVRATYATAGSFGQGVASVQGNLTGTVAGLADDAITPGSFLPNSITATALASSFTDAVETSVEAGVADVLDATAGIETGWTIRQSLRQLLRFICGVKADMDTSSPKVRDMADSKDAATVTGADADGNWTSVSHDNT